MVRTNKYYKENIEPLYPRNIIGKLHLLKKLVIWSVCYKREPLSEQIVLEHLGYEFLQGCYSAGIVFKYKDEPENIYLNPYKANVFEVFLRNYN